MVILSGRIDAFILQSRFSLNFAKNISEYVENVISKEGNYWTANKLKTKIEIII